MLSRRRSIRPRIKYPSLIRAGNWDEPRKRKDDGEICITLFILALTFDISHAFVAVVDVCKAVNNAV